MIDLHTHSTISDGSDEPERVAELAALAGCSAFALTDHDRLDGIERARARATELGVELISGCELSCESEGAGPRGSMHVLVYFVEPGEGPLQDELVRLLRVRRDRNERLVARLQSLGMDVTFDDLVRAAGKEDGIGRPNIASVLVAKGYADSIQDAFDKWLAKGQPGYVEKERLTPETALRLARAAGGVPVLAHPLSLGQTGSVLQSTLEELTALGMGGMECIYGRYSDEERAALRTMADRLRLVATGGSDHHGTFKPDLNVGSGRGDLHVPDDVLDRLRAVAR